MIIQEAVRDLIVVGEDTSKKATISANKMAKLQYLLTKGLYKDPITAVIAEWTNNGIDSVVQAGKSPVDNPVLVKIERGPTGQYIFRVEDKGCGLDNRDFEDICMNYLESTKENDPNSIGHFGIGMKSFLSLDRSAIFTCRKNGTERKYLVYEGAEFVNYDLLYEKPTSEENGVVAELTIKDWNERNLFVNKASSKLAYYDTAVLVVDGRIISSEIFRHELFQWSSMNTNTNMHLCLKDVYYAIDYEALGISPIIFPVAIRLGLEDGLIPTPSRESYITNDKTKEILLNKIYEIADWFVKQYNSKIVEFKTFKDAHSTIGVSSYRVRLKPSLSELQINPLLAFAKIKVIPIKIKGIDLQDPTFYKNNSYRFFDEWTEVGYITWNGVMRNKRRMTNTARQLFDNQPVVKVGNDFIGNVKEYLKEKYTKQVLFVKRNRFDRRLRTSTIEHLAYIDMLTLNKKPKEKWRAYIKEWNFVVSSLVDNFIDETNVATTKEYEKWLDNKRAIQKANRLKPGMTGYKGLNKQTGDVTLAYSHERYGKVHFKKEVYPIASLSKNKFLTVIVTSEEAEKAKGIIKMMPHTTVRWALVGKLESKKIPNHSQFINFQTFMSIQCKPFQRLASAILFNNTLEKLNEVQNYKSGIFRDILKHLKKDKEELEKYVKLNSRYMDPELRSMIIDVADNHKLYDQSLFDVHERVKQNIKKYDFVNLLKEPNVYDAASVKRYETLITQLLLFRKKYYNDLPDGTKIVFEKAEIKTEENELV